MNNTGRQSYSSQSVIGIVLLLLGIGFLLNSFDVWDFGRIIGDWWPSIIILFGLMGLLNSSGSRVGSYIIIAIGVLLQLSELDVFDFNIWSLFWPAILIIIGLSILFYRPHTAVSASDDVIDLFAAFGGIQRKVTSKIFKGGNITTLFGGVELDLREAKIVEGATLNILAAFGGVDIRVAPNVQVHTTGTPIFGGWEDKTEKDIKGKEVQHLAVRGTVLFGGFSIKN